MTKSEDVTLSVRDRPFSFEQSADDTGCHGKPRMLSAEHAVEEYRLIPNSQLAILPGTDHTTLMSRTAWLVPMVHAFLDAPMPRSQ
jgi:hypothetical protein